MWFLLVVNILLLVICVWKHKIVLWTGLGIFEFVCFGYACLRWQYYNALPGYGKAPGLTYFPEFIHYFLFSGVFLLMFLVSVVGFIVVMLKKDKTL